MNYYVLNYFAEIYSLHQGATFYIVLSVLSLSFFLAVFYQRSSRCRCATVIYAVSATWMGILWLSFSSFIVLDIVRLFVVVPLRIVGTLIICAVIGAAVYSLFNARRIETKEFTVKMPKLKKNMSIVHLSDTHIGTINKSKFLARIVKMTNLLKPELILITGDMFDSSAKLSKYGINPLEDMKAPAFFSIGNHEQYEGIAQTSALLRSVGIKVLRNEKITCKGIHIVAVDDPGNSEKDIGPLLKSLKISSPSIMMYHRNSQYKAAEQNGIDLQLSGHTHNGQIFPFNLFGEILMKYRYGLHKYKNMYIHISGGTGTWGPPMRLGSRNEIVKLNLVK